MKRLCGAALALLAVPAVSAGQADAGPLEAEVRALAGAYDANAKNQDPEHRQKRRAVVYRLGELPTPGSRKKLLSILVEDPAPRVRVAALRSLGAIADAKSMRKAFDIVQRPKEELLRSSFAEAVAACRDPEVGKWLLTRLPEEEDDDVRLALVEAFGALRLADAEPQLLKLYSGTKSRALRYESLRALGHIGGDGGCRAVVTAASSADPVRRLAAAEVLLRCGRDDRILDAMRKLLADESPLVHEEAARAVGAAGVVDLAPELIDLLEKGTLRVRGTAQKSLVRLSGRRLGFAPETWRRWWKERTAEIPPGDGMSVLTYHGVEVFSDRLLFLVDVSESMKVGDRGRSRIDVAKGELVRTISTLSRDTRFNVIAFAGSPSWWQKGKLEPATDQNRRKAKAWVEKRLLPRGGTNTHDTLLLALEGTPGLDTIYLLSDGLPTAGKSVVPEVILARVRSANRLRKVRIHTIALALGSRADPQQRGLGELAEMRDFMRRLAEQNGGEYREIPGESR